VDVFPINSTGIVTARDGFTIQESPDAVNEVIDDFLSLTDEQAREKYNLGQDVRDWSVAGARKDLKTSKRNIVPISYRPFDVRYTNYTGITKGFHCMPRNNVMQNFIDIAKKVNAPFKAAEKLGTLLSAAPIREINKAIESVNAPFRAAEKINAIFKTNEKVNALFRIADTVETSSNFANKFTSPLQKVISSMAETMNAPLKVAETVKASFSAIENVGLLCCRQTAVNSWEHIGITNTIVDDSRVSNRTKERGYVFPLYLYPEQSDLLSDTTRRPNLDPKIIERITETIGLEFEPEKSGGTDKFAPIDLLDYIYAVLHSPAYREKYKEFLKIDFPRVPYPADAAEFRRFAALGSELRQLHLMEHLALSKLITTYPIAGNNVVEKPRWEPYSDSETGRVWINNTQYFDKVPQVAWNFYIGGYQPAQKWLKDRKGRTLSFDDIMHYQRIIVALKMTEEIMTQIS